MATSAEEKQLGMFAHLSGIILGFVGPLIIYLVATKEKPFAYKQAVNAFNFQIVITIAMVVASILSFIIIGAFLMPIIWLANIIFCVLAGMAANNGEDYKYPFTINLLK